MFVSEYIKVYDSENDYNYDYDKKERKKHRIREYEEERPRGGSRKFSRGGGVIFLRSLRIA